MSGEKSNQESKVQISQGLLEKKGRKKISRKGTKALKKLVRWSCFNV